MKENDLVTREKIISCTLDLLQAEKDFSKITVRRIVQNAGASVSAVNYHFGSKEKLINEVIKRPILQYMKANPDPHIKYKGDPVGMLKESVKLPADYLVDNPNLSRVSILSDISSPLENDLSVQTMQYWEPFAKEVFPLKTEQEVGLILWEISCMLQTAFLRNLNFKRFTGINFFAKEDRDRFLEDFIDKLIIKWKV